MWKVRAANPLAEWIKESECPQQESSWMSKTEKRDNKGDSNHEIRHKTTVLVNE